ncbi:MAG TPA: N-acetylmuramoyl-L-alanine amidase-like domain-containing protein [Syntrophorhabdaceae bacterium]|jgi:hypothetical protein
MSEDGIIKLGKWSVGELERLMEEASSLPETGPRIERISGMLLGTPYRASTLIGSDRIPERLVIDLEGVDCFTLIDYVEAMRLSRSLPGFRDALIRVRYREGRVSFKGRNHFFTDWLYSPRNPVADVTREIGGVECRSAVKRLNLKKDGSLFLPGIEVTEREITYIPGESIDSVLEKRIREGDYIGIYTFEEGLDVSHVGIFVGRENTGRLRHASSSYESRKVVDQPFEDYVSRKPGIIVVRPGL